MICDGIVLREILGDTVLVPVKTVPGGFNGIFSLNESGRIIYDRILAGDTDEQIAQALFNEYETTIEQARADTDEFLVRIVKLGIAKECK